MEEICSAYNKVEQINKLHSFRVLGGRVHSDVNYRYRVSLRRIDTLYRHAAHTT